MCRFVRRDTTISGSLVKSFQTFSDLLADGVCVVHDMPLCQSQSVSDGANDDAKISQFDLIDDLMYYNSIRNTNTLSVVTLIVTLKFSREFFFIVSLFGVHFILIWV